MSTIHPKLIEIVVEQTPRAMIAMLIVSSAYFLIFIKFIPFSVLSAWFFFQILLAVCRFYNAKMFSEYLRQKNQKKIDKNEKFFVILNVFQALMWTISSIFAVIYAGKPFELVTFVMVIGIITAAALSMSSLYRAYLIFFLFMIVPQVMIMLYYSDHQHLGIVALTVIYIPAIILLSKAMLNSRISSIEAHDQLAKNTAQLAKSAEEFRKLSIVDNLTNIYNRRYFFDVSNNIILIAAREQKKVSLLMIDIDHFKDVNDNYGHQAGDFILKNLAQCIEKRIRKSDIFARVGGEEFAILLNDTSLEGAKIVAEKVRHIIEKNHFTYNSIAIETTISIGIAELSGENASIECLYRQADDQLYVAKEQGRNRVSF